MSIEKRIENLEKSARIGKQEKIWLVVVTGGLNSEAADAKVKAAKAQYRAEHPECKDINTIAVTDERVKDMLAHIGDRTGNLIGEARQEDS
jgi:hypothetical protein